jgi:hypothetical protein
MEMASRGPKLVCDACGEDVRLYSLVENGGMVIGCGCEDVRHSEDALPYEMGVQHTIDDWRVAHEEEGDPWKILDRGGEVVDTAESGSEAMQLKEEIGERVPWGRPYEIVGRGEDA